MRFASCIIDAAPDFHSDDVTSPFPDCLVKSLVLVRPRRALPVSGP
jgi:hypothetical protein